MMRQPRETRTAVGLAGVLRLLLAALVAAPAPAWSQRRRDEPEANPQFSPQADSRAGQPAADAEEEASAAEEEAPKSQGIQIGASAGGARAAAAPVSPLETRVSVRVKGAPLATFLDTISAQAKVNFIITEGLETKQVTAFLQNVTVREALQVLLEIKGLTYQQIGKSNTYVIAPRSKTAETVITRIYTLNYIPLIPLGASGSTGGSGAAGGGGAADATVSIIAVIRSVLSKAGQVALEPRTNAIIVTDIPEVFPQVEQIVAELDKKSPQVLIEAQIVEINSDRTRELGFDWGGASGQMASLTLGSRETFFPLNLPRNLGNAKFFDPLEGTVAGLTPTLTPAKFDLSSLAVTLRALVTRSEARFLGKPKVLTLNNKAAVIEVSEQTAIGFQQSQQSGGAITSAVQAAERVTTGLILRVTPQVNKEGYITMLVQPSFVDTKASSIGVNVRDSVTRGASTLVRIKNGQTLVLGGLLRSVENKTTRKVPFLGYIPLLGWLFTSTTMTRRNLDLVFFITPTIVSD